MPARVGSMEMTILKEIAAAGGKLACVTIIADHSPIKPGGTTGRPYKDTTTIKKLIDNLDRKGLIYLDRRVSDLACLTQKGKDVLR